MPSNKGFSSVIALFSVLLVVAGISGFFYLNKQETRQIAKEITVNSPSPQNTSPDECHLSGMQSKKEYLDSYTVKKGDTLLSIAKNELNDNSRVNELIEVNKEFYPELSLEKPFLEQGWKLYLPPKEITTNGLIYVMSGNLSIGDKFWGVSWINGGGGGTFSKEDLAGTNLKNGDCITVIYQGVDIKLGGTHKLIKVVPQ